MHEWLKHKPTMHPSHFRDLLHPNDGNFIPPSGSNHIVSEEKDIDPEPQQSWSEAAFHAYAAVATHDATDSVDESEEVPQETHASKGGNQTRMAFPSPPPALASTVNFTSWLQVCLVDLNSSAPSSPVVAVHSGSQGPSSTLPANIRATGSCLPTPVQPPAFESKCLRSPLLQSLVPG
jgi:hypothetical protein